MPPVSTRLLVGPLPCMRRRGRAALRVSNGVPAIASGESGSAAVAAAALPPGGGESCPVVLYEVYVGRRRLPHHLSLPLKHGTQGRDGRTGVELTTPAIAREVPACLLSYVNCGSDDRGASGPIAETVVVEIVSQFLFEGLEIEGAHGAMHGGAPLLEFLRRKWSGF